MNAQAPQSHDVVRARLSCTNIIVLIFWINQGGIHICNWQHSATGCHVSPWTTEAVAGPANGAPLSHIMYQVHFPSQSRCMTDACALPHCHLQEDHPNSCVRTRQLIPCALQRRIDFIVLSPSFIVDNSDATALSLHNVHPR